MKSGKIVARFASVSVALLMGVANCPTRPWAQSFDCAEASTPSERLVCDDRKLAEFDITLADEVKKALAAAPAQRERLLGDERRWVAERTLAWFNRNLRLPKDSKRSSSSATHESSSLPSTSSRGTL